MVDGNAMLWAMKEFRNSDLGDERRGWRGAKILYGLATQVGVCISLCCGAMAAQLVSRFLKRKEVTLRSVLKSHITETGRRCQKADTIIVSQDTTSLNYSSHKSLEGLGSIGKAGNSNIKGLWMHSALAVTLDRTPLGMVSCKVWARDPETQERSKSFYKNHPIEEKESFKWLEALKNAEDAISANKDVIMVGDRENDIYEYFTYPRRSNTDILVRASHPARCIEDEEFENLGEKIEKSSFIGDHVVKVPAAPGRKARDARLRIKSFKVKIKRPSSCPDRTLPEVVELSCIVAAEADAPAGTKEPLHWVLLTSLPVETLEDAIYGIRVYSTRWVIEEFHKVLKDGAKVERLQLETIDSLLPAIGLLCLVAWRVLYITKFARESPDYPADKFASKTEICVLESWMMVKMNRKHRQIKTISDFVLFVALLGGFMGRKSDGNPGAKVVWRGLRKLEHMAEYHKIYEKLNAK